MGNMGGGVYPYVLYDLEGVDNLASYFRGLGYGTHAIHPAEAANWRRDRIYEQLGFDTFDDITTMEDADTFRDLVTDRATYERVLEKIDEGEGPQFVFDVTIQNHGGYDTGLVPAADAVHLESDEVENPEVDEFLAAIRRSDEDLRWLVEELNARTSPPSSYSSATTSPGSPTGSSRKPSTSPWRAPVWKRCRRATGRRISSGRTLRPAGSTGTHSRASRTPTSRA